MNRPLPGPGHWLALLLLLGLAQHAMAEETVKIIALEHRLAAELVPTLEPFVDEQGVLTAKDNKLIIRSSLRNIGEIRELAEQLDQPLQRLLIEVRQPLAGSRAAERTTVSGQSESPEQTARIVIERHRSAGRDQAASGQRLQVLDGRSAVIKSGQLVPMAKRQLRDGQAETVIEHQDVSSGFRVTPHLTGDDRVMLQIAPFSATLDSGGGGVINRQQAVTTVSGKLGEWLEIGGISDSQQEQEQEQTRVYATHRRDEQQRRILIKVTRLE
ncbi:hypothetical protein Tel_10210 [Candidatus Tenderia electrophaga]|uniref:NolW-like domain-containing protein n=1 Tax=Candidatus Tenderia electrophaga TaxID=1748243 RepID=A0A0S2TEB0_9GAMM|nr:hypothetical protein Tel_10210 [Candidatus Tenderia electrophaga]